MDSKTRPSFSGIVASQLFCPTCNKAQPVRQKLLLVLPSGDKIGYFCKVCGREIGAKQQESPPGQGWLSAT